MQADPAPVQTVPPGPEADAEAPDLPLALPQDPGVERKRRYALDALIVLVLVLLAVVSVSTVGPLAIGITSSIYLLAAATALLAGATYLFNATGGLEERTDAGLRPEVRRKGSRLLAIVSVATLVAVALMAVVEVFAFLYFIHVYQAIGTGGLILAANFVLFQTIMVLVNLGALVARANAASHYRPRPSSRALANVLAVLAAVVLAFGVLIASGRWQVSTIEPRQAVYIVTLALLLESVAMRIRLRLPSLASMLRREPAAATAPQPPRESEPLPRGAASDGGAPLFRVARDERKARRQVILAASISGAAVLLIPGALLALGIPVFGIPPTAWIHFVCLGLLAGLGPYGFYMSREGHRIRGLEERFSDFLRDVASGHQGGLTLPAAVIVASRGEYGPLTPEVQRMADQLSWNLPFTEALERFAERVDTPLIRRAVNLVLQANRSGGSTIEVLMAASRDAREIKSLETERRLTMSLYTVVIYITFFVFLGVAATLYASFVPKLVAASQAAQEAQLGAGGSVGGIGGPTLNLRDFQVFYFMAAILQGLGDGIVAGLMGTGRAVLGLRHSFAMVLFAYLTFTFFL
ncbi:MAG TPA: type II secretion system F family protein [Candidatus Thermoplasmatota archaeon]|nr:type II secretion system F family protein [Candidatus Thermoplasmatota archaeon]